MIRMGLGVALGARVGGGAAPAPPAENLLLWTEAFDNAVWVATSATVAANVAEDPLETVTADSVEFTTGTATLRQSSSVAASTGGATATVSLSASWQRRAVTATFDVGEYTFSLWLLDGAGSTPDIRLALAVAGGVIRCEIRDLGDNALFYAWGAKLEAGSSATGGATDYGKKEGA